MSIRARYLVFCKAPLRLEDLERAEECVEREHGGQLALLLAELADVQDLLRDANALGRGDLAARRARIERMLRQLRGPRPAGSAASIKVHACMPPGRTSPG